MSKVRFAGVPTATLMHLDEGSGWTKSALATNHTLSERLLTLSRQVPKVRELMIEALEAQRTDTDTELRSWLSDPPTFAKGEELYSIGHGIMTEYEIMKERAERAEKRARRAEKQLEETQESLLEMMATQDRAEKFRCAVVAQRAQKRAMQSEAGPSCKRQRPL